MIKSGDIELREMVKSDGQFVLEIRNDDRTRNLLHNPQTFTIESFESWFKAKRPWWFILSYEGKNFGYFRTALPITTNGNRTIQVGMDIHPDFRGRGLAKPSFEKAFSYLRGHDYGGVWLEVLEKNTLAHKIYTDLGFEEIGRSNEDNEQETSIKMSRWINTSHIFRQDEIKIEKLWREKMLEREKMLKNERS